MSDLTIPTNVLEIPLGSKKYPGKIALVDPEDYDYLVLFGWSYNLTSSGCSYAITSIKGKTTRMHNLVLRLKKPYEPDHIDGNGLHNWRKNLRKSTRSLNNGNRKKYSNAVSSKYKGVSFDKNRSKWMLQFKCGDVWVKRRYDTEVEAALAYNELAQKHFGEFARPNIID